MDCELFRKYFVQYKNRDSEVPRVCCGVPQGSILGPTLFIMHFNEIFNASKLFKCIIFAEDTNMFYCNNELIRHAERHKLNMWFSVNILSLNIAKTNYMIFGNSPLKMFLSIKINKVTNNRIEVVLYLFLGVLIDDSLTWKHLSLEI